MPDLKVGHDYHLAEVKHLRGDMYRLLGFQAYCEACGWVGHARIDRKAALDDAYAHDEAENAS